MPPQLHERITSGEILLGTVLNMTNPTMVEICCGAGADFLFLDFEHGLRDFSDISSAILAADLCGTPALVRLGERSANLVARMLDAGAAGIIFPHVSSAAEAAELVSWCRYKPGGQRGSGLARGFLRNAGNEFDRRLQANRDVVCVMIVEDLKGMDDIAKIAAVEGVTAIGIGPGDLSMAMGASSWDDDRVTQALDKMTRSVRENSDCAVMRLALDREAVSDCVQKGVTMVLVTHDAHLIKAMYRGLLVEFRDAASDARSTDEITR